MRVTQRGSQRYMEKRRGRRELEVTRMRWGGIKRGDSKLASNHTSLCALHSLDHSEIFMELHRQKKREEGDRGGQEDKRGEWKGERQIQPVISSLSVLHRMEHSKRFTELGREEKGEGGDRGDLVEKKESPKEETAVKSVISFRSKNGYWRLGS